MSQPLHIFKFLRATAIIFVAALYCLAPLQQPLADGFHKLEHTILNTNSNHSHELAHTLGSDHSHDHKLLSFFNDLFSDDAQGDEQPIKEYKLDKHVVQQYVVQNYLIPPVSEENFSYSFTAYSISIPYILPPPKSAFSYF